MFVSSAQAPYAGVYQRQPTGLPQAEFIPQYPAIPAANGHQAAYQNNHFGGQQVCISFSLSFSMNLNTI